MKPTRNSVFDLLKRFEPPFIPWLWKAHLIAAAALALLFPLTIYAGWLRVPQIEFFNGMAWQPKAKAQSTAPATRAGTPFFSDGVTLRLPVAGTAPRDHRSYPYQPALLGEEKAKETAGAELLNPLPASLPNLKRGEILFDTYCQPCHGYKGMADGSAVGTGRLAAPNSLHSEIARNYRDGHIFHIVTVGQKKMPAYAWQLAPLDRWAAVLHVRTLQRAVAPRTGDLPATATLANGAEATSSTQPIQETR